METKTVLLCGDIDHFMNRLSNIENVEINNYTVPCVILQNKIRLQIIRDYRYIQIDKLGIEFDFVIQYFVTDQAVMDTIDILEERIKKCIKKDTYIFMLRHYVNQNRDCYIHKDSGTLITMYGILSDTIYQFLKYGNPNDSYTRFIHFDSDNLKSNSESLASKLELLIEKPPPTSNDTRLKYVAFLINQTNQLIENIATSRYEIPLNEYVCDSSKKLLIEYYENRNYTVRDMTTKLIIC